MALADRERFGELDVLRGLCAVAVMLHHYLSGFADRFGHTAACPWRFDEGQYGVHLFFMISGFVILLTLGRVRTAADFMVARAARLYPAYWYAVLLTGTVMLLAPLPGWQLSAGDVAANLSMGQRFLGIPNVDQVYWTLSIELMFYALMLGLWRTGALRRPLLVAGGWLAFEAAHLAAERLGVPLIAALKPLVLWGYAHLFVAGMLFLRVRLGRAGIADHLLIVACLALQARQGLLPLAIVTAFFALFYLSAWRRLDVIAVRPLVLLGTISYSVYLLHQNLGFILIRAGYALGVHPYLSIAAAAAVTLALATAVTFLVERPAQEAIRRWWSARRAASAKEPAAA